MLELLKLNNFHSDVKVPKDLSKDVFVLKTCQRTLFLSLNHNHLTIGSNDSNDNLMGESAYVYILEIICGLKSRLLGENEIVAQFKASYKEYLKHPERCSKLLLILEKLLQDAKKIRTKYLLGLSQKTYSSIARKAINKHSPNSVLILGSGQLATDLINQFKKNTQVYISARNETKTNELIQNHKIQQIDWKNFEKYLSFPFILSSIGCTNKIIFEDFFQKWTLIHGDKKLFVDLGSPSVIDTPLGLSDGIMRLDDVFNDGAIQEENKLAQVNNAKQAMVELSKQRNSILQKKLHIK